MKRMMAVLICTMLLCMPLSARASGLKDLLGFLFPDRHSEQVEDSVQAMSPEAAVKALQDAGLNVELDWTLSLMDDPAAPCTVMDVLIVLGLGRYDDNAYEWTPVSHAVYAFDGEVFDLGNMYTDFLRGIQMIVPDVEITEVREDLSGMTEDMDFSTGIPSNGRRAFSFRCNGTPYALELDSYGDWFNAEAISFMEEVLRKENCPGRLAVLNAMDIQGVVLFYADEETIANVMDLLGVQEGEAIF